jgi:hypothetical protein
MTFSCKASTFTRTSSSEIKPLDQQIQRIINSAPELKIYDEIIVTVKFRLNTDNKIIVISNDSDNYEITKFIKTTLALKKLTIENKNNNRIYSVPVRFLSTAD